MAVLHPHPPFGDLTYYPISRWIRGTRGQDTIVNSRRGAWAAGLSHWSGDVVPGPPEPGYRPGSSTQMTR